MKIIETETAGDQNVEWISKKFVTFHDSYGPLKKSLEGKMIWNIVCI